MVPNLKTTCILCGSTADLNTVMGVALEDEEKTKIQVTLCDECCEDCTPKKAREAYVKKQSQINEVLAQAKALGMDLSGMSQGGLVLAQAPAIAQAAVVPQQTVVQPQVLFPGVSPILEGDDVISTAIIDRGQMISVGGQVAHASGAMQANVPSHASHSLSSLQSKLPPDLRQGQARMQIIEGRGGQPLAIPSLRVDKTGVTRIRVVKSNDHQLQQRAKRLVGESMPTEAWKRPSFRDGYRMEQTEHRCPICSGSGEIINAGVRQLCPKCQGTGVISS